ncbi:proteinase B [Entomophthora muscae]|uniref:Proteinase B n=1 Tax=Entomophthora muscae TaxID=34485 RepID=A0ACC2T8A1_9FUNG|nr:proteinase B [Entomophthora muscae]
MISEYLIFIILVNKCFTEALRDPANEDTLSRTHAPDDCAFNWDDTQVSGKKKWSPYELQPTPSAFPILGEQDSDVDEFKSEKDKLEFRIDVKAGLGVDVYILDTGIKISHEEFGGRARLGKNFVKSEPHDDLNGHGTHVAGIIGSFSYGVAKQATLISVKCMNKNKQGEREDIVSAIEWALASSRQQSRPSIIHLSAIVSPDEKIDSAVEAAAQLGVPVIVAGANDFPDACNFSPARSKHALTVSGIDSKDQRPENIAQGQCVDLFAPGMHILSTYIDPNVTLAYMSGTSMAAPYVTGIAASVLSRGFDMGYCMLPHFDSSRKSGPCTSRLYDYLKQSSDHVAGLRIARIPKDLIEE